MKSGSQKEVESMEATSNEHKSEFWQLSSMAQANCMLVTLVVVAQSYLFLSPDYHVLWQPTYIGWMTGILGGMLWIVNEYLMNLKSIVLLPTDKHWMQFIGRLVMGAFSGATVVTLFSSVPFFAMQPKQAALGLVGGYSGVVIGLLATKLNKWIEGKHDKTTHSLDAT